MHIAGERVLGCGNDTLINSRLAEDHLSTYIQLWYETVKLFEARWHAMMPMLGKLSNKYLLTGK